MHNTLILTPFSATKKTLKFTFSIVLGILFSLSLSAQKQRAINWTFPQTNALDFSSGTAITGVSSATGLGGGASISDVNGNLVCYSNGATIWQANGAVMMGGAGLAGNSMATQSSIIIPSVTSNTRYYVFTNSAQSLNIELNYYDVEMSLNGGNGMVVGPTLLLDPSTEKLCATRHGNDRDYWVVAHRYNSDEFHAFLIDENGVNVTPIVSAIGVQHLSSAGGGEYQGMMKISPDGQWIVTCNFASGNVQLFKFNNQTGQVTEPLTLAVGPTIFPYGAEFSADSKKLYYTRKASSVVNPNGFHQFDLDHASTDCLLASEQIITNGNPFKPYSDIQLGPDKNIYLFPVNIYIPNIDTLSAILEADKMCPDCGFVNQHLQTDDNLTGGGINFASSFLSDGITYEFGSNCEFETTMFTPEDTLGLDSVNWNFGDPTSGSNTSNLLNAGHVFSGPDTFLVTLYAFRGAAIDTFTRNVIIWDVEYNLLGNDTTICNGQPIALDGTWNNACLEWNDGSTNNTLPVSTAGTYWVDVSYQSCEWRDSINVLLTNNPPQFSLGNDTLVCSNTNFLVDPNLPNAFYTWQDGSHDTTFTVTTTGVYWLAATNSCGTTTDSINVELNQSAQPVLAFPDDTTLCITEDLTLDVTFENAVYLWNDGSAQSIKTIDEEGTYWVRVANVCDTVSDTITVFFDDPLISSLDEIGLLCDDADSLILIGTADSSAVFWSTNQTSPSIEVRTANTYWFEDSNACGLISDTIEVLLWDSTYTLNIGGDTVLCDEQTIVLIGDQQQDYPWIYAWSNEENAALIEASVGNYSLKATNRCNQQEVQIAIKLRPPVMINEVESRTVCSGETLTLSIPDTNNLNSVIWTTGDTARHIEITAAGIYFVDIIDSFGCSQQDSIQMNDLCPGLVGSPNVFSPNGDGVNDEFCIDLENIIDYKIYLYDRWGVRVFQSDNQSTCWDGSIRGQKASSGTFYYVIETEDAQNEKASYRGSFTLLN